MGHTTPGVVRLVSEPGAARRARRVVDDRLRGLSADVVERVKLLVSELTSNAVRHGAGGEITLDIAVAADVIRVEVGNMGGTMGLPAAPAKPRMRSGGYGLWIVDRLATRWGVAEDADVVVWLEIDR